MAFWALFKFIDPLGLETATKRASATIFNAISAPFYGMSSDMTHRHVAVVAINDVTLHEFATSYPLAYSFHIRTLNQILDAHPAAIFVDLRMQNELTGQSLNDFRPVIQRAKDMGVPLLFGRGDDGAGDPPLPEPLTQSQGYTEGIEEASGAYPLIVEHEGRDAEEEGPPVSANAAYDLYSRLCGRDGWGGRCPGFRPEDFKLPMIIQWGIEPDPAQHLVSDLSGFWQVRCQAAPDWLPADIRRNAAARHIGRVARRLRCGRLGTTLALGWHYTFGHQSPGKYAFAFYPLTIGAEQLDTRPDGTPDTAPPMLSLLKGRAVFYGTDLRDQHDDVYIPAIGRVPGAVAHAMAFDNLAVYGRRYFHEPAEAHWLDSAELAELAIWICFALYMTIRREQWQTGTHDLAQRALHSMAAHTPQWCAIRLHRLENAMRTYVADGTSMRRKVRLRVCMILLTAAALFAFDMWQRGTMRGAANLLGAYGLLVLLLVVTWATPVKGEPTYVRKVLILASIAAIGFVLNGDGPRWPNADWIGLVLLQLATQETSEETGFVAWASNLLSRLLDTGRDYAKSRTTHIGKETGE